MARCRARASARSVTPAEIARRKQAGERLANWHRSAQWGPRERALIRLGFSVVEATPSGVSDLAQQFRTDLPQERATPGGALPPALDMRLAVDPYLWLGERSPSAPQIAALLVDLKAALGEQVFLYLAALAVFPAIHPKLTLALGRALPDRQNHSLLTEQTLALLCRVPWLRRGRMPDWLLLALVRDLETRPDEADRVRATWSTLLAPQEDGARTMLPIEVVRQAEAGLPAMVARLLMLLGSGAILGALVATLINTTSNAAIEAKSLPWDVSLVLTYAACGLLIVAYEWGRFNTPPSNRCSTRQTLYWRSCVGYVLSRSVLFAVLCILLQSLPWRTALLCATLAATVLPSIIPMLRRLDQRFLSVFLDLAKIPAELKHRAATMTLESFSVTKEDLEKLRESYNNYSEILASRPREGFDDKLEITQYCFIRVVKLYDRIRKLQGVLRYTRFFAEAGVEFDALDYKTGNFLRRTNTSLKLAERLRGAEKEGVYGEFARERREHVANSCRDMFRELALFLARAVLRSESRENGIVRRLRDIGFAATELMSVPESFVGSLTFLGLGLLLYLALAGWFVAQGTGATPQKTSGNLAVLTYAACGLLIIAYAWGRFNTPPSNRSSTRQALFWSSGIGYVLSTLVLFAALSIMLNASPWRQLVVGPADDLALSAPLIATLAMTTLLPAIPTLKRVDAWFLSIFLDWAEIPGEVRRRVAVMTLENFNVTSEDVAALRQSYQEAGYGDTLVRHLRKRGGDGLGHSQARLTRVVKLYDCICKLAGEPRYSHFFSEAASEFNELDRKATDFLRRAAIGLTLAERLRVAEKEGTYNELIQERREDFASSCRDMFRVLALFLARAVLRSETSEMGVVRRLRAIGFDAAAPMNLPRFPIHSLTVLALGVFVYLLVPIVFFNRVMATPEQQQTAGLMTAVKAASIRLGTIALTVWLMQRYSFFRRVPGDPPRFFAYVLNGVIAAAVAAGIGLLFHPGNPDPLAAGDVAPILLSFMMCSALALCCDDWIADTMPPMWWRLAEAAGCAVAVALGMALIVTYLPEALKIPSDRLSGLTLVMLFALPSALALMIGACVPHIYRSARRAAAARRNEASQLVAQAPPDRRFVGEQIRPSPLP
jgi:hypothetical protein